MKSKIKISIVLAICLTGLALCGCEADKAEASTGTASYTQLELSQFDYDIERVIGSATKEFMGNHPIDQSFFAWFISEYGIQAFNDILAKNKFDDPAVWIDASGRSIHVLWYEYCQDTGLDAFENHYTYVVNTNYDDEVTFDITGDVSMADDKATTTYMIEQPNGLMDCFDDDVFDAINESDIFIINNEFAYTTGGDPIVEKYYTFRSNPDRLRELFSIGVDSVTLANNHVYDYREEGLLDTLKTLEGSRMPYIGAGRNLEDASQPIYYIAGGRKIAIVNASQIEKNQNFTKAATEDSAGILKCLDPTHFTEVISEAKKNSDCVLAIVHWGTEYQDRYGKDQNDLANAFAEAGADVIIGGHPHVLQGFDYIGDTPVYYSLGNFYFSLDENMPADYETGIATVTVRKDGSIDAGFIPCYFSDGVVSVVTDDADETKIRSRLNNVSNNAILDSKGIIRKK